MMEDNINEIHGGRRGTDYMLGNHAATLSALVIGVAAIQLDVSAIKMTMSEKKGERKVAMWIAGAAGGIAASILGVAVVPLIKLLEGN